MQFARRDYQHRARRASLADPRDRQWLTVATHLPHGRRTLILDARLAEPERCRRRVAQLVRQHYGRSQHGQAVQAVLEPRVPVRYGWATLRPIRSRPRA
ncbi:WbqC family protein [Streptomyces sp. E11-3]|uniref:WbqC family protein n=1 Tax=Streptomyces sp. E11-3 TaxID=3110112 RepID=UPI00397EDC44